MSSLRVPRAVFLDLGGTLLVEESYQLRWGVEVAARSVGITPIWFCVDAPRRCDLSQRAGSWLEFADLFGGATA